MRNKVEGFQNVKNKFDPSKSTYHAILLKEHGEKAKVLLKASSLEQLFVGFKNVKVAPAKQTTPHKPKHKLRLWEDLEGVRDLIEKQ